MCLCVYTCYDMRSEDTFRELVLPSIVWGPEMELRS